jgi:hypothetical protein
MAGGFLRASQRSTGLARTDLGAAASTPAVPPYQKYKGLFFNAFLMLCA